MGSDLPKAEFLKIGIIDTWGWKHLCCVGSVSLGAVSLSAIPCIVGCLAESLASPVVTTKNVTRHCQISP